MDEVSEIKARLPIEQLVGQYCQLKKKGRNFVCLCPFHNDTHPSLLVSPDKGIAYCFACSKGGDIFKFYEEIEHVDFKQALHDLAEKTGVKLEERAGKPAMPKDEKERLRECLNAAQKFFRQQLTVMPVAQEYIRKRQVTPQEIEFFGLGFAPDSFSLTYDHLLKEGFSRSEIVAAGLGVQRDLADGRIFDRFRNRLMFPIWDHQGNLVAFGGRAIGEEDAKYVNSSDGPLYSKSQVLYGLNLGREAIREKNAVIMVEGYFDLLACHKVGCPHAVAVSGTALTEQHVKLLKRYAETAILCLDQDRAGRDAAERSFQLLAHEGFQVHVVSMAEKDPDEAAKANPVLLKQLLSDGGMPYLDFVLEEIGKGDVHSAQGKRAALQRVLPLIQSIVSSVEQTHYMGRVASTLGTTETALRDDLKRLPTVTFTQKQETTDVTAVKSDQFSPLEIALGLFLLYPQHRSLLAELIEPHDGFPAALYRALKNVPEGEAWSLASLDLPQQEKERASILHLFCEVHGFTDWSDNLASREIRKNCMRANHLTLRIKQIQIAAQLKEAHAQGRFVEESQLSTQYQQVLKLAKMAG
ncbi:MAG: DNA primase [Candidatus Peribacteraceae bacterium]|nr:DNA primase [Candidatus Peribacteraceae bacterium]MDD5074437.1 DNA primase [Candidatus Peribacteraceae bacterium]